MALMRETFLLVTGVDSWLTSSPQIDGLGRTTTAEGITTDLGSFAALRFRGVRSDRIGKGQQEQQVITVALSDLVLLRARLTILMHDAVEKGLLEVPEELW